MAGSLNKIGRFTATEYDTKKKKPLEEERTKTSQFFKNLSVFKNLTLKGFLTVVLICLFPQMEFHFLSVIEMSFFLIIRK